MESKIKKLLPQDLRKLSSIFITIGVLLSPLSLAFYYVSINSNSLINSAISFVLLFVGLLTLGLLLIGLYIKKSIQILMRKWKLALCTGLAVLYTFAGVVVLCLLYIPSIGFQDWLITTAMTTQSHQHYAKWFYDSYTISNVRSRNEVVDLGLDSDPNLINFDKPDFSQTTFASEFEAQILTPDPGNATYKIIDLDRDGYTGKMAVIYDPSKIKIGTSLGMANNTSAWGQYVWEIANNNKAVIGINASGFYDPNWNSAGGFPHGIVIKNGKLISDNSKAGVGGGLVGFTSDNKLVLAKMTSEEALEMGIRDAVEFGPFLIVNGKSAFVAGNGGWGKAPRTVVAQRKDGIVLLICIDGRQIGSAGADMGDLVGLLEDYGAYNAANMDGGTSTSMTLNGKIITKPIDGNFKPKTRPVPNAWIVVE